MLYKNIENENKCYLLIFVISKNQMSSIKKYLLLSEFAEVNTLSL